MVSRAGAPPRWADRCPVDVGHRHRCRARHVSGVVALRGGSMIWVRLGENGWRAARDGVTPQPVVATPHDVTIVPCHPTGLV
jgi:hypothetical protein